MYYVMAENDSSEVLRLAEHRVSVSCALNLSSSQLEGEVIPEDSVSQTSRSTKKSSSTATSSAWLKAAARMAALMARAQVLQLYIYSRSKSCLLYTSPSPRDA